MSKFVFTALPVVPLRITSRFGPRNTGIKGATTYHKGMDLGRNKELKQTPIYSVAKGTVIKNAYDPVRGYLLIIKHDVNYCTLYQHLKCRSTCEVGQTVKSGQQIGIMGNTSSKLRIAEHLHFELWQYGRSIDPEPYLKEIEMAIDKNEVRQVVKEELSGTGKQVSDWAKDAWDKATEEKLLDGTNPKGYVTREQLAVILNRLMKEAK